MVTFRKSPDELLVDLKNAIDSDKKYYTQRLAYLEEEIDRLKDPLIKDKTIQEMQTKLDKMTDDYYRGFPISEKEQKAIDEWKENHINKKHGGKACSSAIGGKFSYCFTPTSIGTFGKIKCICGEEFTFQEEA